MVRFWVYFALVMLGLQVFSLVVSGASGEELIFALAIFLALCLFVGGMGVVAGLLFLRATDAVEEKLGELNQQYQLNQKMKKLLGWLMIAASVLVFLWLSGSGSGSFDPDERYIWRPR
jgi:hypothetical protein